MTLIEILITVVLLGSCVTAVMGALFTIGSVSRQQRDNSVMEAEGRRLAERIRAYQYTECAAPDWAGDGSRLPDDLGYDPARSVYYDPFVDSGVESSVITDVEILEVGVWPMPVGEELGTAPTFTQVSADPAVNDVTPCGGERDCGLQQIKIRIHAGDRTRELTFLKRNTEGILCGS